MEEEKISPDYVKGFNNGYLLQQHEPVLIAGIAKQENKGNEFLKAVRAGQKQYQEEKAHETIKQAKEKANKEKTSEREI